MLDQTKPEAREVLSPQIAALMNALLEGRHHRWHRRRRRESRPSAGRQDRHHRRLHRRVVHRLHAGSRRRRVGRASTRRRASGQGDRGRRRRFRSGKSFMEEALRDEPPVAFPEVEGVAHASVDRATGLRAVETAGCVEIINETLPSGHRADPRLLGRRSTRGCVSRGIWQRYDLDEDGALVVPEDDLAALVGDRAQI